MTKQGCNEQKLDIRRQGLGNLALDRITLLQPEVLWCKSSVALGKCHILPRED